MRARALRLRAFAVGYGHDAGRALATQGHAYLTYALPFAAALGVVALAAMLRRPLAGTERMSLRRTWFAVACALVAAYFTQELLEGALAGGHPAGLAGVFGADGWTAVVFAVPVGMLVALGLRGDGALAPRAIARMRAGSALGADQAK